MTPFYHPTSILVLDDDPLFLESLDFQFSEEVSCQTFTRPDAALEHLRAQADQHPNFGRYFRDVSEMHPAKASRFGDLVLKLQLSELQSIIDDRAREQRVSVAVVDYDMPKMTGVEFSRSIRDLPVKVILLTGKAGLETAIGAFNEGVIDCFLQKQDSGVTYALRREIKRLQNQYFAEISAPIQSALALQKPTFFDDPTFIELFRDLSEKHEIVEHYISDAPQGIMMRDAEGNESFLLISDTESAASQCAAAESQGAPDDMVRLLRTRRAHAWFPTNGGHYHPDYHSSWTRFIWPAQSLSASSRWCYSVVNRQADEMPLRSQSA
ncbi:Response regulator [Hyphomicrobium sp. 1Nfss2.1]|uniref:response regulator n=1 Tax=Hyphomicrobium sp. 1Nfss2.1 TaxID=3413936 RepID=UPI003C7B6039